MDPLSTEGRLIESASRSGKLLSIRNGTALENIGTGAVYGRTPEGALARVDPEGGDISFLNTNKDMFIPSGITGSVEMLSTELFVEKKDILASKTLKHYLRQTAPYAANFTGSILGA
jgi:outer membrane protein assembly factor BamB